MTDDELRVIQLINAHPGAYGVPLLDHPGEYLYRHETGAGPNIRADIVRRLAVAGHIRMTMMSAKPTEDISTWHFEVRAIEGLHAAIPGGWKNAFK